MIGECLIVDAISHAQDLRAESILGAGQVLKTLTHQSIAFLPKQARAPNIDILPSADDMCNALFRESLVDLAVTHHVPLYSYIKDGVVSIDTNVALARRAPQRWIVYAGVDPTRGVEQAIESLEEQIKLIPQTIGIKLYPAQLDPLRTLRIDDENFFPLWARARDLGIRVISVHKAVPYGPVPIHPFRVEDFEGAAGAFPELNFEIIHGGLAFVEETAMMIARFPNVYVNLEGMNFLEYIAPQRFERVLAEFIFRGGAEKLIWGTGGPQVGHPQFYLDRFLQFQFSETVQKEFGIPPLSDELRAAVLGGTYMRMVGLDVDDVKRGIANDEFARDLKEKGVAPMFSTWNRPRQQTAV